MLKNLSFEELIIWACKSEEKELRTRIFQTLKDDGCEIFKDSYLSYRHQYDSLLNNTLFIKGNPKVCLVAHTDTCRVHCAYSLGFKEPTPTPIIKYMDNERILQDYNCKTQLGADDRLGVAIAIWTILRSDDCALLLTTDEEIGLQSAYELDIPRIKDFELMLQIDRGNQSNQIVNRIGGLDLCDKLTSESLKMISSKRNLREIVTGKPTDVYALKKQNKIQNAVNITCGYHNSNGQSGREYINLREATETLFFVKDILNYFTEASYQNYQVSHQNMEFHSHL